MACCDIQKVYCNLLGAARHYLACGGGSVRRTAKSGIYGVKLVSFLHINIRKFVWGPIFLANRAESGLNPALLHHTRSLRQTCNMQPLIEIRSFNDCSLLPSNRLS